MQPSLHRERLHGKEVWVLRSESIVCALTRDGGHMAPVTFFADTSRPLQPYYISPWQDEDVKVDEPVLAPLRGDFFCMPFGGGAAWKGEQHRAHGEVAYRRWKKAEFRDEDGVKTLAMTLQPTIRPGRVTKRLTLRDGENVIYLQHELKGFSGKMPLGHHAILAPPVKGRLHLSTSALRFGQTSPRPAAYSLEREYYALAPNTRFKRLDRVPTIWRDAPHTDCSIFPAREGFVDILSLYAKPGCPPAWTCATAPDAGYLWFSLKDSALLPATTLWMENRGRHGAPWSGRNCCIGLEDVCSYHAEGLKASVRPNDISAEGIPTCLTLSKRKATVINYIQGVTRIPRGFDRVKRVRFKKDQVEFIAHTGQSVTAPVCHDFIKTGAFATP